MIEQKADSNDDAKAKGLIGRIPVRNLWLLMLYASDLFRDLNCANVAVEDNPDEIPDLVAEILCRRVEQRLKRNLSHGYKTKNESLSRVRGRIDLLNTERHFLLDKGKVACRYEELTTDTIRNRYVRAALDSIAKVVSRTSLARRCKSLASSLQRLGIAAVMPSRGEVSINRYGRHDIHDQPMVDAAKLAFDLTLPTEDAGNQHLSSPDREIIWLRKLFEKGVGGFYNYALSQSTWKVVTGKTYDWLIASKSAGIQQILPSMRTDIILDDKENVRRIVIDTKFNSVLTHGWHRDETLRSGYIYQIYAYLRSQEGAGDPLAERASGLLLHPAVGAMLNESVVIQNHLIRFATVNLGGTAKEIRAQLLHLLDQTV